MAEHVTLYPQAELTVGGQRKTVLEAQATIGLRNPFASGSARVAHTEGGFLGTELVRLALGYRALASRRAVCAGTLREDSIRYAPKAVSFGFVGPLARTQEATGIADPAYTTVGDPTLPPEPDPTTYALGWVNATDGQIVTDILALYGITDVNIAGSTHLFAALAPSVTSKYAVRLASDRPGWDLIAELDRLTGYRTFDGPDGRVTRLPVSALPGGVAARTLVEGRDFKGSGATRQKSNDGVYNRVIVRGQGLVDPTTGIATPVQAERYADSPYVPTPPRYRLLTVESDLIESEEYAGEIAARLLGEANRRQETITLPLSYGDSAIYPGMTLGVVSAALDLGLGSLFRVVEVQHTIGGGGYQTTVVLVGGATSEGIDPNARPVATIAYETEIEGLADGSVLIVAALDGSGSHDPDGAIVAHAWSGSPVAPTPIGDGRRAVAVYSPFPATPPTVTLTVTDDRGKTGTATRIIDRDAAPAYRRELWVAQGATTGYTEDGGATWADYPVPTVVLAERAGDAYQLGASATGTLARVLADGTATNPAGPVGVTALHVSRDRQGDATGVAWAAASDGKVWRSVDNGMSWGAVAALPNGGICHAIEESPYSPGDLYAGGGNTLWHSYDAGASWQAFYAHPDPAMILRRFASGVAAGATDDPADDQPVMWLGFSGPAGASPRVVERAGSLTHALPTGEATPLDIVGLTISLDAERLILLDTGAGGRAWTAPTGTGGDLARKVAYVPANLGEPRHVIRDGRFPVAWGASSLAVWKTTNEAESFYTVRDKPAHMVAYGRLIALAPLAGDLLWVAATRDPNNGTLSGAVVNALTATGFVRRAAAAAFPLPDGATHIPLLQVAPGVLLACGAKRASSGEKPAPVGAANCLRSADGGATWAAIAIPYVAWVATDGNGGCYLLAWGTDGTQAGPGAGLYRSTDAGATWTFRSRFDGTSNSGPRAQHVIAHPTDPARVMVRQTTGANQGTAYHLSTDGGATFAPAIAVYDYAAVSGGIVGAYSPDGVWVLTRNESPDPDAIVRSPAGGPAGVAVLAGADGDLIDTFVARGGALVGHGLGGAWLSTDQGANFARILTSAATGFAPGDATSDWYALTAGGIARHGPTGAPTPGGWAAIPAATLTAAFPDGVIGCAPQGALRMMR